MFSSIQRKISLKVALFVSFIIAIVIVIGSFVLIEKQSRSLEAELLRRGEILSIVGAKMVGRIMDEAIDNGVFSVTDAFDTAYDPIGSFDPPKYHTKYDAYLDKSILNLEDEFLLDKSVVFAVAVDMNGYLPVHNTPFQQPITGDHEKDLVGNRTKRIFNDKVGITAAKNKEKGFLQVYHRDTGETMWDISSPIFVKGKQWGGFRIGFSLVSVNKAKTHLELTLGFIMGLILIISLLATFITVRTVMAPLEQLTLIATDLADSKNLDQKIPVTRQDEIGKLEEVLERLRLSMVLVLNRKKK
jgi:HAMP domain-containing protein